MKTKADFQQAIADSISKYPKAALFYQVRDPRLLAQLDAAASMLSMLSSEQDVAAMEPFTKARDMTVLADAAVKGVLPFGKGHRVKILCTNLSQVAFNIDSGRGLVDANGRAYTVTLGATIPAGGSASIEATQTTTRTLNHTVSVSKAFYEIEVPPPDLGYIAQVKVADSDGVAFDYAADFLNVAVGDKVFHLKTDENRVLSIQFGATDTVGYQPQAGENFVVSVIDTEGDIALSIGALFYFQYNGSVYESGAKLEMTEVLSPGSGPMDISTMREVCSYPSVYDSNAVYLGNFDFLVRRNLSPFEFLSIWNEQREEEVRGPSADNINCLFIAARKTGVDDMTLRALIGTVINAADDSYRLKFVDTVDDEIGVEITVYAQSVYDFAVVKQDVIRLVLSLYGVSSAWAKRGQARIMYKELYDTLTKSIQALQDRNSDLRVNVQDIDIAYAPERFRYVSLNSLTVNVLEAS